jgi:hypothetical protein
MERVGLLAEDAPARSAGCDACGQDHVEPVVWLDIPGRERRAFIPCPVNGRVPVPPARLRRWSVPFGGLAEAVRSACTAAGAAEEVVSGRVWRLGVVTAGGRRWAAFLARGMARPDAAAVAGLVPEFRTGAALVFVPDDVPPPAVWGGDRSPVVARLVDCFELSGDGVSIDRAYLESLAAPPGPLAPPTAAFPTPAGTRWQDVTLSVGHNQLHVRVGNVTRSFSAAAAGFGDGRTEAAQGRNWTLLSLLARYGGTLPDDTGRKTPKLKQTVSRLRAALRALMQIEGDPFHPATKRRPYRPKFRVVPAGPGTVAVPPGAGWADVSLTETTTGEIAVSVTVEARGATWRPAGEHGPDGWDATTEHVEDTRTYRLAEWKLADAAGSPNPAGEALLAVLRGRGRVRMPQSDHGMLALGKRLTEVFGISDPPFAYVSSSRTWASRFTADSAVPVR